MRSLPAPAPPPLCRLLRILRLDPGPQRRITQLQYLEQAQRAQGGQGLRNVAPGGLAALPRGGGVTRRAHSPGTRPPCPCAPSRPGIRPGSRHQAIRLRFHVGSLPRRAAVMARAAGTGATIERHAGKTAAFRSFNTAFMPTPTPPAPCSIPPWRVPARGPRAIAVRRDDAELRDTAMHRHARGQLLGARRGLITVYAGDRHGSRRPLRRCGFLRAGRMGWRSHGPYSGYSVYLSPAACAGCPRRRARWRRPPCCWRPWSAWPPGTAKRGTRRAGAWSK